MADERRRARELEEAAAANHTALYALRARAAGGEVREAEGVTWTSRAGEGMVLFPRLTPERAGPQLDAVVRSYLERPPGGTVGCWSLDPPDTPDLGARLLARGFRPGWQPCWMHRDLAEPLGEHAPPPGVRVEALDAAPAWEAPQLPYYDRATAALYRRIAELEPGRIWHFVAWEGGQPVGQSLLLISGGPLGCAGLYDVGVVPAARGRGVGKAVVAAALRQARALGCGRALLNATGERMYRQLGFQKVGYGLTWWLDVARLAERPHSPERVRLAEAVALGDVGALGGLGDVGDLGQPLASGMTLVGLAAHMRRPESAEWLLARGAPVEVVAAWDLGWRRRVAEALAADPALASAPHGQHAETPLHTAAERGDAELAALLLAARPDLSARDSTFRATPLDWARHLGRHEIARMIEATAGAWESGSVGERESGRGGAG